jgi:3-isopropylmalate/(R)-2-methylmalate dehydratase small subunit
LISRANFACGSSREHAAWGVLDYGFRAVIAPSFGDIFYNNCFKNGILPVTLPDEQMDELFRRVESQEGYSLSVDLPSQTVRDGNGLHFRFEIDPARKEILLKGLDDIGMTLRHAEAIAAYEAKARPAAEMYDAAAVDVLIAGPRA